MLDFIYYNPARVVFGKDSLSHLGKMIKAHGGTRVLFHYGEGSIKKHGIYDKVIDILNDAGVYYHELGGVKPNPRLSLIRKGIELCKEVDIDFILAAGGGSVIDSAKAIAAGVKYDGDIWDCYMSGTPVTSALPLGAIVTIPAAGSETSPRTVVTNEETNFKRGGGGEGIIPKFAILNPEFTYTLPDYQTACGGADIMAHLMERYFTNVKNVDLTDRLIEGSLKTMLNNIPAALKDPTNYNYRAEIMWTGTVAHGNLLDTGRLGDWGSHNIGHELSASYDLAHGASLSIIFPAWMKYVYKANIDKFVQFAQRVFDVDLAFEDKDRIVLEMIKRLENFYHSIGLPTRLSEAGIGSEQLEIMAERATVGRGTVGKLVELKSEDIYEIYKLAL